MATVKMRFKPKVSGIRLWIDGTEVEFQVVEGAIQKQHLMDIVEIEWEADVKLVARYVVSRRK